MSSLEDAYLILGFFAQTEPRRVCAFVDVQCVAIPGGGLRILESASDKQERCCNDGQTECRGTPEEVVLTLPGARNRLRGFMCPAHLEQTLKYISEASLNIEYVPPRGEARERQDKTG